MSGARGMVANSNLTVVPLGNNHPIVDQDRTNMWNLVWRFFPFLGRVGLGSFLDRYCH